jgi:hypothetical protein
MIFNQLSLKVGDPASEYRNFCRNNIKTLVFDKLGNCLEEIWCHSLKILINSMTSEVSFLKGLGRNFEPRQILCLGSNFS